MMNAAELLILNPFIVLRGLCNPAVSSLANQTAFFYMRSFVDLVYGIAGGAVMYSALRKAVTSNGSRGERNSALIRSGLLALTILAMPWVYRVLFQLSDVFITQAYTSDSASYPIAAAFASAVKGGLMAGAGLLAHAFAPIVGGAAGGLALGLVGEIVAFCGLAVYLCIAFIATIQLAYLLVMVGCQSLLFALQVILGPVFMVCGAHAKTEKLAAGYLASWLDLTIWLVSNVLLLGAMRLIFFSDLNPWGKIAMVLFVMQAMIFAPRAFSILNISPLSKYLAMNPLLGLARGASQLAKTGIEIYSSFHPPR